MARLEESGPAGISERSRGGRRRAPGGRSRARRGYGGRWRLGASTFQLANAASVSGRSGRGPVGLEQVRLPGSASPVFICSVADRAQRGLVGGRDAEGAQQLLERLLVLALLGVDAGEQQAGVGAVGWAFTPFLQTTIASMKRPMPRYASASGL